MFKLCCGICNECWYVGNESTCTCPKESTWVGLTEEEVIDCWPLIMLHPNCAEFWKNIEAKLKEKNERSI